MLSMDGVQQKGSGGGGESNGESSAKRPRVDMSSLPTRQYLDQTVVPILLQAVTQLNKERLVFLDPLKMIQSGHCY